MATDYYIIIKSPKYAAMAQVVEHVLGKDEVTSSNLVSSSKKDFAEMQSPFLFRLFTSRQAYHSSPSTSTLPSTTAPAWERWNMLSTTAQYLSARQTIMASRQVGT